MKIVNKTDELRELLSEEGSLKKSIGLVPTMGALHKGHLSLVKRCKTENDICVASIFVNPTQFNDKNDLKAYPRQLDEDSLMLEKYDCDILFAPSEKEIYPEPDTRVFNLGSVAEVMEGKHRPGHFNGVAQIVSKLFEIVQPDKSYFGEKDFQQIAVIKEMVRQLKFKVNIIPCPVIREEDGLAMSSRNVRLSAEERRIAPKIAEVLKESLNFAPAKSVLSVKTWVCDTLNALPHLRVEYFDIADSNSLIEIKDWNETKEAIGCITVFCGDVRLIDNIKYNIQNDY
jgi:pantoate--beta-alanine ligase